MMKSYTAYCMNEDGENMCMTREYNSKKDFINDLHGNGYKVHFVALTDKYDEESEKYNARRIQKNREAKIRREAERAWAKRSAEIRAEIEARYAAEEAAAEAEEEPAADQAEETTTLKNYDEVRETLIETIADLETRKNRYQTDIYLYIDENGHGTIDTFANVGGNSWLNDDHITIYTDREHCETKLDDLQNGDGRGAWNWLIDELESAYNLTGIKEKIYNLCCDDDDDDPSFKSFDDLEPYDIESALYALYCDEIDNYYKDYFIPDCCMDYIGEYADQALEEYR